MVDLALCVTRSSGLLEADVEAAADVRRVGVPVPVQSGEVLVGEGELPSQTVSAPLEQQKDHRMLGREQGGD